MSERLPASRSNYTTNHLQLLNDHLPALIDVSQVPKHASPILSTLDRGAAVTYMAQVSLALVTAFSSKVDVELPQCKLWATIVYEDYNDLRIAEINIIIKNAVKEKQYGAIDVNTMLSWVAAYYPIRSDVMSDYREQYHRRLKEQFDNPQLESGGGPPDPEMVQRWRDQERHLKMNNIGQNAGIRKIKGSSQKSKSAAAKKLEFQEAREYLRGLRNLKNEI